MTPDSRESIKICSRYSLEIAPPGLYTDDYQWRYELKEGDLIDCMDTEGTWYRSTILETRETQLVVNNPKYTPNDSNELPQINQTFKEVYVAYRFYCEEEGHKTDEEGKKYVGWSNKYDTWLPVTIPIV